MAADAPDVRTLEVRGWLLPASEDLRAGRHDLTAVPPLLTDVAFHAQHEGASFAFCAGISRGGPGRAVAASFGVFTVGSPGRPRWPTGWAESLSGSLRGRVPG